MRVAVIGGGVAGLRGAHEFSERGFEVSVCEKQEVSGGKARSVPIPGTATGGRRPPGGARPSHNAEPLLVNYANTWTLRPTAYTRLPNLYLAADYVQTYTDVATMEVANETARRATNGLLRATGRASHLAGSGIYRSLGGCCLGGREDAVRWRRGLPWCTRSVHPGTARVVHGR